jgi:hypothetical protein
MRGQEGNIPEMRGQEANIPENERKGGKLT